MKSLLKMTMSTNAVAIAPVIARKRIFGAKKRKLSARLPTILSGRNNIGKKYIVVSAAVMNIRRFFDKVMITPFE